MCVAGSLVFGFGFFCWLLLLALGSWTYPVSSEIRNQKSRNIYSCWRLLPSLTLTHHETQRRAPFRVLLVLFVFVLLCCLLASCGWQRRAAASPLALSLCVHLNQTVDWSHWESPAAPIARRALSALHVSFCPAASASVSLFLRLSDLSFCAHHHLFLSLSLSLHFLIQRRKRHHHFHGPQKSNLLSNAAPPVGIDTALFVHLVFSSYIHLFIIHSFIQLINFELTWLPGSSRQQRKHLPSRYRKPTTTPPAPSRLPEQAH